MKNCIKIFVLLVTALVISIPITSVAQQNTVLGERNLKILESVEQRFIDKFGKEAHVELRNDITVAVYSYFYNYVLYSYPDYNGGYVVVVEKSLEKDRNIDTTDLEGLLNMLIAWCELIAEICWLTFGHGEIGTSIAWIVCMALMFFPCRICTIVGVLEDNTFFTDIWDLIDGLNLDEYLNWGYLLYQYGIAGFVIILLIISPLLIIVLPLLLLFMAVMFPVARAIMTLELLLYVTAEVFGNSHITQ